MAFDVAPTSGGGPYVLSAVFSDTQYIDGVNYNLSVGYSTTVGSCPQRGVNAFLSPAQINTLLTNGSVTSGTPVPLGSCRTYTLTLSRVRKPTVIASQSVFVDNV